MRLVVLLAAAVLAGGCASDRYPISGEGCRPGDPVQNMGVQTCPAM